MIFPMHKGIPSLAALRAFECAARHGNIAAAARELNVTHVAIGKQIRLLEETLGAALLQRPGRFKLTHAGEELAQELTEGFHILARATRRLHARRAENGNILSVSAGAAFTARWLLPRLNGFTEANPDASFRLSFNGGGVDFEREGVDLAIRRGWIPGPGYAIIPFLPTRTVAVCAPRLLQTGPPITRITDMLAYPLIHDADFSAECNEWKLWFAAQGEEIETNGGLVFGSSAQAYQSVLEGQGIALVSDALLKGPIDRGNLTVLFGYGPRDPNLVWENGGYRAIGPEEEPPAYRIIHPAGARPSPMAQKFIAWLVKNGCGEGA